jgi:hypothetical protein
MVHGGSGDVALRDDAPSAADAVVIVAATAMAAATSKTRCLGSHARWNTALI